MSLHYRLIQLSANKRLHFSLVVLSGFAASGLVVIQSWLLSRVIDRVFLSQAKLSDVLPMLKVTLGIILCRALFTFLSNWLAGSLAEKVKHELRKALLQKIDNLGPIWLRKQKTGELATTLLQGVDALENYFSQFLPQVILAAVLPLVILFVVFPLDVLTGIVLLITAPLIPLFMVLIGKMSENVTRRQWNRLRQLGEFLLDSIRGLKTLLLLGRERDRLEEVRSVSDEYRKSTLNVLKITFLSAFTLEMIATIATAVVAVEIGLRLLYGQVDFQTAFFILLLAPEFYLPMRNLSVRYHAGMAGVTAAVSIYKVLDETERYPVMTKAKFQTPPDFSQKKLEVKNVSFSYDQSEIDVLSDVHFSFLPGRQYVLTGENGAGKSTLFNLLLQFLQPDEGTIELEGENITGWDARTWRKSISWLGQRPLIFNTTLLENTRLFDHTFSEQQVEESLKMAGLEDLLQKLPMGLQTPLWEMGERFSRGERQRLAIARAFLKNGSLLLMDEPVSHLDVLSAQKFFAALNTLVMNRTTITIAHHVSTMQLADEILVLHKGLLVQTGTYSDLISRKGFFSDLMKAGNT